MTKHVWTVRVRTETDGGIVSHARNHSLRFGRAISFAPTDAYPTAVESAVSALAADLIDTFRRLASKRQVELDSVECSVNWNLQNPLVHLQVIGEVGSPSIESIQGTLYISSDADDSLLQSLFKEAMKLSPLFATFEKSTQLDFRLLATG